jgi:hypothetical protein
MYNLVLISAVITPLIFFISEDPTVSFVLECAGFVFAVVLVLGVLFGPKFYRLATGKGEERSGMTIGTRSRISNRTKTNNNATTTTTSNSTPTSRGTMDTVVTGIIILLLMT